MRWMCTCNCDVSSAMPTRTCSSTYHRHIKFVRVLPFLFSRSHNIYLIVLEASCLAYIVEHRLRNITKSTILSGKEGDASCVLQEPCRCLHRKREYSCLF